MNLDLLNLSEYELVALYPKLIATLKMKNVIHSKNITGDLGEYLVINHYNSTPGLPKLQRALKGTANLDATGKNGLRYSIKTTTSGQSGAFHGLPRFGSLEKAEQTFDLVIVAKLNDNYSLEKVVELKWNDFMKVKTWNSRSLTWHIYLSKKLLKAAKIVYTST